MFYFALGFKKTTKHIAIKTADAAYAADTREAAMKMATDAGHEVVTVICRGQDLPSFESVCELTALLSVTPGMNDRDWLEVDQGPNVHPRYEVVDAPELYSDVSYAFNGDSYPCGTITKIGESKRRIEATDSNGTVRVFWRRRLTGSWKLDGTWSLVAGHHSRWNPEF